MPPKRRASSKGAKKPTKREAPHRSSAANLRAQKAKQDSLEVLNILRSQGLVFSQAVCDVGTTPRTVRRHVGEALKKDTRGRVVAMPHDRIPRTMRFITQRGLIAVTVHDSRIASEIGRHSSAVNQFLLTGDEGPLQPFHGEGIRAGQLFHPFVTDPDTLEHLAYAGEVSFEDLYALTTGEHK